MWFSASMEPTEEFQCMSNSLCTMTRNWLRVSICNLDGFWGARAGHTGPLLECTSDLLGMGQLGGLTFSSLLEFCFQSYAIICLKLVCRLYCLIIGNMCCKFEVSVFNKCFVSIYIWGCEWNVELWKLNLTWGSSKDNRFFSYAAIIDFEFFPAVLMRPLT